MCQKFANIEFGDVIHFRYGIGCGEAFGVVQEKCLDMFGEFLRVRMDNGGYETVYNILPDEREKGINKVGAYLATAKDIEWQKHLKTLDK